MMEQQPHPDTVGVYIKEETLTRGSGMFKYTVYQVVLQPGDLVIERRFSDFLRLRNNLKSCLLKNEKLPELPPKKVLSRFDPNVIQYRRVHLEKFLKMVLDEPRFQSHFIAFIGEPETNQNSRASKRKTMKSQPERPVSMSIDDDYSDDEYDETIPQWARQNNSFNSSFNSTTATSTSPISTPTKTK